MHKWWMHGYGIILYACDNECVRCNYCYSIADMLIWRNSFQASKCVIAYWPLSHLRFGLSSSLKLSNRHMTIWRFAELQSPERRWGSGQNQKRTKRFGILAPWLTWHRGPFSILTNPSLSFSGSKLVCILRIVVILWMRQVPTGLIKSW